VWEYEGGGLDGRWRYPATKRRLAVPRVERGVMSETTTQLSGHIGDGEKISAQLPLKHELGMI